jgi:hypothetical protein
MPGTDHAAENGGSGEAPSDLARVLSSIDQNTNAVNLAVVEITKIAGNLQQPMATEKTSNAWNGLIKFTASGLFFMIVGSLFLLIAGNTITRTHSAFTFILVVIGVAILLYGTGTQGMGTVDSTSEAAKYKVQIAGGAGVLAFVVAFGIIHFAPAIKDAFQVQKKYVRVIVAGNDGYTDLQNFASEFTIDGMPVPAFRAGSLVEIFVPYLETENDLSFSIVPVYRPLVALNPFVDPSKAIPIPITIPKGNFGIHDGSYEFPKYSQMPISVSLKKGDVDQKQAEQTKNGANAREDSLNSSSNRPPPKVSEPPLLPGNT